jgi:hypothetical protein
MKKTLSFILVALFFATVAAQEDTISSPWTRKGEVSLMFSQTSFSNWAAGGENSITMSGFFNYYAGYEQGKSKWENFIALGFGQTKTGERGFRKSEDKIDLLSTYGLKAAEKWFYMANLAFKTQFIEGYDYHDDDPALDKSKISNFMAPGYLTIGLGMEYKPYEFMSFYLSPITARWIIVNDQDLANAGAFGVQKAEFDPFDSDLILTGGEKVRQEFGANFRFLFDKEIIKNISFSTKLELFSNYLEDPQNIDVNWDNTLNMKVNKWITAMVGVLMIYDDNTPIVINDEGHLGKRTQVKQLIAVGLNYNF